MFFSQTSDKIFSGIRQQTKDLKEALVRMSAFSSQYTKYWVSWFHIFV